MTIVCMALSDSLILVCDLCPVSLISVQISAYGIYVYSYRLCFGVTGLRLEKWFASFFSGLN